MSPAPLKSADRANWWLLYATVAAITMGVASLAASWCRLTSRPSTSLLSAKLCDLPCGSDPIALSTMPARSPFAVSPTTPLFTVWSPTLRSDRDFRAFRIWIESDTGRTLTPRTGPTECNWHRRGVAYLVTFDLADLPSDSTATWKVWFQWSQPVEYAAELWTWEPVHLR